MKTKENALTLSSESTNDRHVRWGLGVIAALGCVMGMSCTKHNPLVCCVAADDCTAIGASAPEPCPNNLACVMNECQVPDAGVDAPLDASTSCATNMDCSAPTPYCSSDHVCVECVASSQCSGNTPVCDASSSTCRACGADSECASNVCDASAGACVAESSILYASPSGSDVTSCTQASPCSLGHAVTLAGPLRDFVSLAPGSYTASVTIANKTVFIHGVGATLNAPSGGHAFVISDGGELHLFGMSIQDANTGTGNTTLDCEPTGTAPPTLAIDMASIDAGDIAVFGNPCTVTVSRTAIHERTADVPPLLALGSMSTANIDRCKFDGGDGLQASNAAAAHVTNSVIVNQTGPDGAFLGGTLFSSTAGSMSVSFSTIINSVLKCPTGTPVCAGGSAAGACMDNSLVYYYGAAPTDTITGSACVVTYSLMYPQTSAVTGSNNKPGTNPQLVSPTSGDYHLSLTSPAINSADPAATDAIDYDGTQRPQGGRSDMGAFEYH